MPVKWASKTKVLKWLIYWSVFACQYLQKTVLCSSAKLAELVVLGAILWAIPCLVSCIWLWSECVRVSGLTSHSTHNISFWRRVFCWFCSIDIWQCESANFETHKQCFNACGILSKLISSLAVKGVMSLSQNCVVDNSSTVSNAHNAKKPHKLWCIVQWMACAEWYQQWIWSNK